MATPWVSHSSQVFGFLGERSFHALWQICRFENMSLLSQWSPAEGASRAEDTLEDSVGEHLRVVRWKHSAPPNGALEMMVTTAKVLFSGGPSIFDWCAERNGVPSAMRVLHSRIISERGDSSESSALWRGVTICDNKGQRGLHSAKSVAHS